MDKEKTLLNHSEHFDNLPNIENVLSASDCRVARFIKPAKTGKNTPLIHERHAIGNYRPHSQILSISNIYLDKNMVIPFSLREKTEQLLIADKGTFKIYINVEGKLSVFPLHPGSSRFRELIIPPNSAVAIQCLEDVSVISIIASSKETNDIIWEKRTDELTHGKEKDCKNHKHKVHSH